MLVTENNYNLNKNKYFLNWFHSQIVSGYDMYLDISDFQRLIDYIAFWYESKFPDNNCCDDFNDIENICDVFTFEQLMYRLNKDVYEFIQCNYRGEEKEFIPFYDENGIPVFYFENICVNIISNNPEKKKSFVVKFDSSSGIVNNTTELFNIGIIDEDNNYSVSNLLYILNTKFKYTYDSNELKKVIKRHKTDLKLRKILMILAGKKILSNDDCASDIRSLRYRSFINDFNTIFYDLRLDEKDNSSDVKQLLKS